MHVQNMVIYINNKSKKLLDNLMSHYRLFASITLGFVTSDSLFEWINLVSDVCMVVTEWTRQFTGALNWASSGSVGGMHIGRYSAAYPRTSDRPQ